MPTTAPTSPRKLKPKQRRFLAAFPATFEIKATAIEIGVGERTCHTWLTEPSFKAALNKVMDDAVQHIEFAHYRNGLGRDTLARIHILKSRRPEVYGDRSKLEVTHKSAAVNPTQPALNPIDHATIAAAAIALLLRSGVVQAPQRPDPLDSAVTVSPPQQPIKALSPLIEPGSD